MDLSWEQEAKVVASIHVMELEIVTDVRSEAVNADCPMLITLSGIVTDVRPEHIKEPSPIYSKLLGNVTDVRSKQFWKA